MNGDLMMEEDDGITLANYEEVAVEENGPALVLSQFVKEEIDRIAVEESDEDDDNDDEEEEEGVGRSDLDKPDDPSVRALRAEDERLEEQLQIISEFEQGKPQAQLQREHPSYTKSQIWRIVQGKTRLDGSAKAGRRPALLPNTEVALACAIQDLMQNHNVLLSPRRLSQWCVALWLAENPTCKDAPPKFGPGWRRHFNLRHPHLRLKSTRVPGSQVRREEASTMRNVASALNHYKMELGEIEAAHVFACDEFDASANDKGLGSRRLSVGNCKPKHTASNKTPHVSAVPFVCLSGFQVFTQFVVQGHQRSSWKTSPTLRNGTILYNAKGSVDADSWIEICKRFAAFVDKEFGPCPREHRVIVFFDGYPAHENLEAMAILEAHGITAVRIQPNLTHIIQINDHHRINGRIQGAIREMKAAICQENEGKMVPVEDWCHMVEGVICNSITYMGVVEAARSIGIVYSNNLKSMRMSNDSIELALRKLRLEGKLRSDPDVDDQGRIMLRDQGMIDYLRQRIQRGEHARLFSETAIKAVHAYSDNLVYERTGRASSKTAPRAYKAVSTSKKSGGLRRLSDPATSVAAKRLKENEDANARSAAAAKARLDARALKERAKEEALARDAEARRLRDERLAEIKKLCPEVDLSPHLRILKPYLEGKLQLDEAADLLISRLERGY